MTEPRGEVCRILYVEDSAEDLQILREAIAFAGVPVELHAARTAKEASQCLAGGRFDLLLVDWNVPGLAGIDLLRDLRMIAPNLPVMILTGEPRMVDATAASGLGVQTILRKPLALEEWEEVASRIYEQCGKPLVKATATADAP